MPAFGLLGTQFVAVSFNLVAAAGAFLVARSQRLALESRTRRTCQASRAGTSRQTSPALQPRPASTRLRFACTSLALAMSGFAAMGMEILWFRHVSILLGGFRAVFSLLMTVILVGIGAGSLAVGPVAATAPRGPAGEWLMVVQGLFVALTLLGLAAADAGAIEQAP